MKKALIIIISAILCAVMTVGAAADFEANNKTRPKVCTPRMPEYSGEKISIVYYLSIKNHIGTARYEYRLDESEGKNLKAVSTVNFTGLYGDKGHLDEDPDLSAVRTVSHSVFDTCKLPYTQTVPEISPPDGTRFTYMVSFRLIKRTVFYDIYTGVVVGNNNTRQMPLIR